MKTVRTRFFLPAIALLPLVLAFSCSSRLHLDGNGLRVDVKDKEIQRAIDKAGGFPVQKGLSPLGKAKVAEARLLLIPSENSVGIAVPAEVSVMGKHWSGRIAFSAAPGYDPSTGMIYLHDFALREIEVPGLPKELGEVVSVLATDVLQHTVKRYDVHKLDPKNTGEWMAKLVLKGIEVRQDAVAFRLGL